ncbi:MAG TPA: hypothetical protein VME20_12335 [Acidimicrobiales bacterium]|nr:hypothetical protein [Acidimicrobiales bacterium]
MSMPSAAFASKCFRTWRRAATWGRSKLQLARLGAGDQRGSQITDNLGLIVIGIVAIVAIGGLISGLDTTVFTWVSKQLGLS